MQNKRSVILVIQIVIFTVFLILFTAGAGDKAPQARMKVGGFFLVLGIIMLIFKKPIAEGIYNKQVESVKQKSSVQKFIDGINHGGILISSVGIVLILMGFIL